MEEQLSGVLDNLLGMLLLEGSYDIEETSDGFLVSVDTEDAGRLIGVRGESLDALQLILNQIMSRKTGEGLAPSPSTKLGINSVEGFKRVVVDVGGWRKQREEELSKDAEDWGKQVLDSGKEMELEPMSAWQRRIIHTIIGETDGLQTESIGEGRDRHIVIKTKLPSRGPKSKVKKEKDKQSSRSKDLKNTDVETQAS